jgi:hypothetical protein
MQHREVLAAANASEAQVFPVAHKHVFWPHFIAV